METKRELNDILINDDDLQKQNRTKKLMMMIAMALVFLSILIAVIFIITRGEEELGEREVAANNGLTPIESPNEFVNVPLNDNANEEADPFQQILDDIRKREQQNNTNTQVAQTTTPLNQLNLHNQPQIVKNLLHSPCFQLNLAHLLHNQPNLLRQ